MIDVMENIKNLSAALDAETSSLHPSGKLLLLGSQDSVFLKAIKRKADQLGINCDHTSNPLPPYRGIVVDSETVSFNSILDPDVDIDHSYSPGMSAVSQAVMDLLIESGLVWEKDIKGRWHIYRDDYDNTLDKLIASMTDTVRKYGARCLILDNFMCIDTETSEEELRSQTDTIKKLIEFAKKYQVAVILVCHPRKMDAGTNVGIYDIAGTSNIVNLAHRTIGLRRVTDAERENAAKYSEKRRQLLKYDVIVTVVKDRMFGRQNIDVGLYYDPASRRFFSDMDEYDRRFSWDKKEYKEPLPLPPQLLAEERTSEDEAFGAVNDREG